MKRILLSLLILLLVPVYGQSANDTVVDWTTGSPALATFATATGAAAAIVTRTWDGQAATKIHYTAATVGQYTGVKTTGEWDLSDVTDTDYIGLDVGTDAGYNTYYRVYLCCDAGTTFTNYAVSGTILAGAIKPLRGIIPILKTGFTENGTMDWAAIVRIEVRFYRTDTTTTDGDAAYLYGLKKILRYKPKVVISFDDVHSSQYDTAYPIMEAQGIKGTLYVPGDLVGDAGRLTLANITTMYNDGWDVANHTYDHTALIQTGNLTASGTTATFTAANTADALTNPADGTALEVGDSVTIVGSTHTGYNGTFAVASVLSGAGNGCAGENICKFTYTVAEGLTSPSTGNIGYRSKPLATINDSIQDQIDWQTTNGFTEGIDHFAYPQGYYHQDVSDSILSGLSFKTGRMAIKFAAPVSGITHAGRALQNPYEIPVWELKNTVAVADIITSIDDAIAKGFSIFIYGHKIVETPSTSLEFSTADFTSLIADIKAHVDAGDIVAVTISDWYDALTPVISNGDDTTFSASNGGTYYDWSATGLPTNATGAEAGGNNVDYNLASTTMIFGASRPVITLTDGYNTVTKNYRIGVGTSTPRFSGF